MRRKQDKRPIALMAMLVSALEQDGMPEIQASALNLLLQHGPLACDVSEATEATLLRAEVLAFLRGVVRGHPQYGLTTHGMVTYRVSTDARRIGVQVSGSARDLVILQFLALLQVVGVDKIRACQAPDCPRIFVKTYRRDYCSAKCQTRINKRKQRANEAAKRARRKRIA